MSRLTEQTKAPFWKVLEQSLSQVEGLSDAAVDDLLTQFSVLRNDLKASLYGYGDLAGLDQAGLRALQDELDTVIYNAAEEMRRTGVQATQKAWAFGEESARREVAFGTAVQAGTTPEGWAYYYPDEVAPWAGFAVIPPQAEIVKRQLLMASTYDKITLVTEEMRQGVTAQVMNGAVGALSHHEVMANITHIVGIRSHWYFQEIGTTGVSRKAENIFRTEIMTSQNFGKQSALTSLAETDERFKALQKIWLSTGDDRTRDSHIDAHGQVVPLNDVFTVGGQSCMFPLDPILPLRERARCRCTHSPYMEGWGPVGELIGPLNDQIEAEKARRAQEKIDKARKKAGKPTPATRAPGDMSGMGTTNINSAPMYAVQENWMSHTQTYYHDDVLDMPSWSTTNKRMEWDYGSAGKLKDDVATMLNERTSIPYNDCNRFVKQWAHTSNDDDMRSLSIQRSAANIGKPHTRTSAWQNQKLSWMDDQSMDPLENFHSLFEIKRAGGPPEVYPRLKELGYETAQEVEETLLKAMYAHTQEQLKAAGFEEVVIRRGTTLPGEVLKGKQTGDTIRVYGNAMSSWSNDGATAREFMKFKDNSVVMEMRVPRERIIGSFRTGFGCANEWEWVVLGGGIEDEVTLIAIGAGG